MSAEETIAPDFTRVLYWQDVEIGAQLPGFTMALDATTMVLQVSGTQDWEAIHHDEDFARDSGHDGVFYGAAWVQALLARVLTDWMGLQGWVAHLSFQMRAMNANGDTVAAKAKVTDKYHDGERGDLIELEVWLENARSGKSAQGKALVRLPMRTD
jgi:acyl dehydratase